MTKPGVLFLLMLPVSFSLPAQNLVPNPSFEEFITCPDDLVQLDRAKDWFYVNAATTDFFHSCVGPSPTSVSVPYNFAGYQQAHTGEGYAGLSFLYVEDTTFNYDWVDYLGVQLKRPMRSGMQYKVSFYVSLCDSFYRFTGTTTTSGSLNVFSCNFAKDRIYETGTGMLSVPNNFEVILDEPVTDSLGWTKIEGFYTAEGDEEYMIIGPLNHDSSVYKTHRFRTYLGVKSVHAYYYYDDVKVVPVKEDWSDVVLPNIFTPNGDGLNDVFDLGIDCPECALQLKIYNRWGKLLAESETGTWDGKYKGQTCTDGTYYYVVTDLNQVMADRTGFFQLQK